MGSVGFVVVLSLVVLSMMNPRMLLHLLLDHTEAFLLSEKLTKLTGRTDGRTIVKHGRKLADKLDTSEVLHFAGEKVKRRARLLDCLIG